MDEALPEIFSVERPAGEVGRAGGRGSWRRAPHLSTRASAASDCASCFGGFRPYNDALIANQPPEGGPV